MKLSQVVHNILTEKNFSTSYIRFIFFSFSQLKVMIDIHVLFFYKNKLYKNKRL